jgi:hypothetical protein
MSNKRRILSIAVPVVIVLLAAGGCSSPTNSGSTTPASLPASQPPPPATVVVPLNSTPAMPQQVASLKTTAVSVNLSWKDASTNEDGFLVFRSDSLIAQPAKGTTGYEDTGLKPATSYAYEVRSVNSFGRSAAASLTVKTLNPAIVVRLDRIGVRENGESGIREVLGGKGEVQFGIIVSDGKSTVKQTFPPAGSYSLSPDESVSVGATIFETAEVGDSLRIIATAYEDDGGLGEQVLYQTLEIAAKAYLGPAGTAALTLSGVDLSKIAGGVFGAEDDWLGTHDARWDVGSNWGVGNYADVQCKKGDGQVGLRLWFTVQCPVYDY